MKSNMTDANANRQIHNDCRIFQLFLIEKYKKKETEKPARATEGWGGTNEQMA